MHECGIKLMRNGSKYNEMVWACIVERFKKSQRMRNSSRNLEEWEIEEGLWLDDNVNEVRGLYKSKLVWRGIMI